ncbi:MAG TPA: chitobiase/beta-hexosaminidase C-terminal domain-containing protein, partial [Verrucomicrobiales bacterium]|nr:chitobiase/beta-hexosaminidase C-terminal domain-containing protein [Verrucomicrobiales bacterium]
MAVTPALADPIITEFLADNVAGLSDEDGEKMDWIEIHNPAGSPLNLDGWYLTDSSGALTKWRFPAVTVQPGGFLLVWASGKDRRVPGAPLHTNFSLKADGEYLGLVRPDGQTVQQEFAPQFPKQDPDRSYGVNFNGTPLLSEGAALSYSVPASGSGDLTWTQPGFSPAGWTGGFTGAGYGILVPGITVRDVHKSTAALSSLAETDALLALAPGSAGISSEQTVIAQTVNYLHDGGDGHYGSNAVFPAGGGDYFAVKCTGFLQVTAAQAGAWTFGLNSDDGGRIRIDGTNVMVDDTNHGAGDHFGTRTLTEGLHTFEVVFWEQGGGSELEFFAAPGTLTTWSAAFKLVGDTAGGGLAAFTLPAGVSGGTGGFVRTDLQAPMNGINPSVYLRIPFNAPNPASIGSLQMGIRYNDGFVAYLNGTEVARRNAPGAAAWNSTATASRTTEQTLAVEPVNLTPFLSSLTAGTNVLAVHGLNAGVSDGSFFILPELMASTALGAGPSVYFNTPTPGAINGQASSLGRVADTSFSVKRGFYTAPFSLTLSTPTPDAVIRYTTNGDTPTVTTGTVYTAPLNIAGSTIVRAAAFKSGWDSTNVDTQTYLFTSDIILQSSTVAPAGWPTASVNGQVYNYGMDPDIVNAANPAVGGVQQVKDALMAIPSFSLVIDQAAFSSASGIYSNPGGRGFAWERPCSLELLNDDPANGGSFQVNAGVRVRGGFSRDGNNPKHGFHFFFRSDYGPSKLNYPLHGEEGTSEFDTFDLRTSENYSWSYGGDASNTFLREEFTRKTQGAMGSPYSHSRYFHLYINGQYWGLYDTDERPEEGHAEAYFGGSQDDYDVVKSTGSPGGYTTELTHGTITAWQSLWNQSMAMRTDPSNDRYFKLQGLAADGVTKLNDPAFPRLLDVDNQIDYMLLVFLVGSSDAPLTGGGDSVNNWFAYRKRDSDMGFLHFAHDMEHSSFGGDRTGPYTSANATNFNYANPQFIHQNILGNAEYKLRWADRTYRHMFNDGALTATANVARVTGMAQTVGSAIIAESARWGDSKVEPPRTKLDWQTARDSLVSFLASRNPTVISQLQGDGLYPTVAAPGMSQWGGYIASTQQLFLTAPVGTIYYTTDGSDPRLLGGAVNPSAQIFTSATSSDVFIPMGSAAALTPWKYLVTTVDQGTAWRGAPGFPETGWLTGNTEMGYNDGDEVT